MKLDQSLRAEVVGDQTPTRTAVHSSYIKTTAIRNRCQKLRHKLKLRHK